MLGNGWTYLILVRTKESLDHYRGETRRHPARQNSLPLLLSASDECLKARVVAKWIIDGVEAQQMAGVVVHRK
jgi:hypothetical protein